MQELPEPIATLTRKLRVLPGIGTRSALRHALALITHKTGAQELASAIALACEKVRPCSECGFYADASQGSQCAICSNPRRNRSMLCIVENANDVLPIEKAGGYHGLYHCLGGRLSPLDQIGPDSLTFDKLMERIEELKPTEIILALGTDVEGETTALYTLNLIKPTGIPVSRPAMGLPLGGTLEHADSLTLGRALAERRFVDNV